MVDTLFRKKEFHAWWNDSVKNITNFETFFPRSFRAQSRTLTWLLKKISEGFAPELFMVLSNVCAKFEPFLYFKINCKIILKFCIFLVLENGKKIVLKWVQPRGDSNSCLWGDSLISNPIVHEGLIWMLAYLQNFKMILQLILKYRNG